MEIDLERQDDICILRIKGRLAPGDDIDYLSGKASEIKQLRCVKLLGDVHEVPSLGSMGIGFVVSLYASVRQQPGGRLVLVGANPRVRHVLELTRVTTVIPLVDDMASGLAVLRG